MSTITYVLPGSLFCPGVFVCLTPREPHVSGGCTLDKFSDNVSNDDEEEEGFNLKTYECTEDQLTWATRKDSKKLCTGLEQILPDFSSYKTRDRKFCNDSGFSEICTGLLNTLTPDSSALQAQNPPPQKPSDLEKEDPSASYSSEYDSQTHNDSGILLHGHQYSQEQRSKIHYQPTPDMAPCNLPRSITSPHDQPHSSLHQELSDPTTREHRNELVVASGMLDHRVQEEGPTGKLVVAKQRPLDMVGFCPNEEIVMVPSLPLPSPLIASRKADKFSVDGRHSDILFFACNMPCD